LYFDYMVGVNVSLCNAAFLIAAHTSDAHSEAAIGFALLRVLR
jgi:hypothetical protein